MDRGITGRTFRPVSVSSVLTPGGGYPERSIIQPLFELGDLFFADGDL